MQRWCPGCCALTGMHPAVVSFFYEPGLGDILIFEQDVIYYPCYREGLTEILFVCQALWGKCKCKQLNFLGCTQLCVEGGLCVCVGDLRERTLQYVWGFYAPLQRRCSPPRFIPLLKTIHGGSRGSWLFHLFFPWMFSAFGGLNYLSYIRKELLSDTRKKSKWRELSIVHTQTHPRTLTCSASTHTHTHTKVCLHKYTHIADKERGSSNMDAWSSDHRRLKSVIIYILRESFGFLCLECWSAWINRGETSGKREREREKDVFSGGGRLMYQ